MRIWTWGQADAEHADWELDELGFQTTFGPWGQTANTSENDGDSDPDSFELGKVIGIVHEGVLKILKDQVKAKLGQIPILLQADIVWTHTEYGEDGSGTWETRRMMEVWDHGDVTNWRRDKSLSVYWHDSLQHIVRGWDVEEAAADTGTWAHVYGAGNWEQSRMPARTIVERALRDNTDILVHMSCFHNYGAMPVGRTQLVFDPATVYSRRPYVAFAYLYPVEFYHDDGAGDLDLSAPITDNPGDEFYIGAVEPGQTGTPTKGHLRNFSDSTQQVEVFDDHPEYTDPISRIGNGQLDFVSLADNAVSQRYTCVFYSSTQYEVKAEAYRDNSISLHPTINADAAWRGDTSSLFTAPEGGLSIPAAAWQGVPISTSDEYETGVRGQTTDSAWPADSNDQVEITHDNAGSADATGWRPILGRREKSTTQVTIDSTTKFIPTRRIIPANWPVDTKAFIQDQANINEGEISDTQEADIGADSFVGSGLDDITIEGNFNGVWTDTLRITIDSEGTPDTYKVSFDGGSTDEMTGVACTTSPYHVGDGIYVSFGATTGHTDTEYWNSAVKSWGIELKALTANSNVYNSGAIVGTTLPIRDVLASVFTTVDQASGASEGTPARIYVASTVGFTASDDIFIQNPEDPGSAEWRIVDSVVAGQYIDVTVALTQDYPVGSLVAELDSGEAAFWMRPVATAITVEELKRFRLNARLL